MRKNIPTSLLNLTKSNPPLFNLAKQDFIHVSGFIPQKADLIKKDCNFVSKLQSFFVSNIKF
jgi:hypothetical protein